MARINLLPWREQLREERRKQFLVILGGIFVLSCGAVFLGDQYLSGEIARQEARNAFIQQNIAQLDVRIKEISELKTRRQQLLARMKIIQDLQGNRPVIGHVFDQLVRTLPDGVYFRELKMQGDTLSISGEAESNNRVSNLMRNLDASDWFASPTLIEVKATTAGAVDQANTFQLTVKQTQPGAPRCPGPARQGRQTMSLADSLASLRKVDINELSLENLGSWPKPVKVIACLLIMLVVLLLGYQFHLSDMQAQLDSQRNQEETLKQQYASKAFQAANLDAYKQQMVEMEESFGALLRQLPGDTEVPALLEDITRTGLGSGLEFEQIKLLPEVTQQFYVELPIQIIVVGNYHDLATFVSSVSSLPRIVTLHDFDLKPVDDKNANGGGTVSGGGGKLRMNVLAKTYRYNDKGLGK